MEIQLFARDGSLKGTLLLDDEDAALTEGASFIVNSGGYAQESTPLHRKIMGLAPGDARQVDHINGNRLDNRRANLRVVTRAENAQNRANWGASRFRGVYLKKALGRWGASAYRNGRRHHLGYFDSEEEAGEVAAAFRREHMPFAVERS